MPVTRHNVKSTRTAPWYSTIRDELRRAKKDRRVAEKTWLKTRLVVHKQIYSTAKRRVTNIVHQAKTSYYSNKILTSSTSRQLFNVCNNLRGSGKAVVLPSVYPLHQQPDIFCNFFTNKIAEIRAELDRTMLPPHNLSPSFAVRSNFEIFQPVTENEVKAVILKSKPTSCSLDPIPTPLLVESLDLLLPTITNIVNESLTSGSFPTLCKSTVIKPLLKKTGVIPKQFKQLSSCV